MKTLVGGIVLGAAVALVGTQALSQDFGDISPEEMQKMQEIMVEMTTPGPEHEMLAKGAGTYETHIKVFWAGPDGPSMESTGTSEVTSVLDGRFLLQKDKYTMAMPGPDGQMVDREFEGLGLFGYDKFRKMYIGCWADNFSTHMLTMKGNASPDGRTITMYGEMDEPMLGIIGRYVKYVTTHISEEESLFEVYDLAAGDDHKVFEIRYTRQK